MTGSSTYEKRVKRQEWYKKHEQETNDLKKKGINDDNKYMTVLFLMRSISLLDTY